MIPFPSPFGLMRRFMEDLDQLFEGIAGGEPGRVMTFPTIEATERDGQLVVQADVPGLAANQIELEIAPDQLVISGVRSHEHEEERSGFIRSERRYGRFQRVIPLPEGVETSKATATFDNGVLEIRMPLEHPRSRRLEIQEGSQAAQSTRAGQASGSEERPQAAAQAAGQGAR
jgi:HSP20 family protein